MEETYECKICGVQLTDLTRQRLDMLVRPVNMSEPIYTNQIFHTPICEYCVEAILSEVEMLIYRRNDRQKGKTLNDLMVPF